MKSHVQMITIITSTLLFCTSCVTYQTVTPSAEDKYDKLSKLGDLLKKKVLTQDEFLKEKRIILNFQSLNSPTICQYDSHCAQNDYIRNEKSLPFKGKVVPLKELTVCEQIEVDFNSLPQSAFDSLCLGHSTSFDYYYKLRENNCGDFKALIETSKVGYESACVNGVKAGDAED